MGELAKTYTPSEVENAIYERWLAADVFAPDGAGSTADPDLPPFTIIQPPPNVTGSLHLGHAQRTAVEDLMIRHARMRGHAALFLPGLDHASIAAQVVLDGDPREGGREPAVPGPGALPRADARVQRLDPAGHARPATPGGWVVRLGPAALHDGRGFGESGPGRVRPPLPGRSGLPDRGTRQLVPRLPDERQRPRGGRPTPRPGRSGPSATTCSTRRAARPTPTRRSPWPPPAPRRSWATPRSRSIRTTRAMRPSSVARCGSRSSSATCRSSRTRPSIRRSGPAQSRSRRPTITTTTPSACATASHRSRSSPTTPRSPAPARPMTASTGPRPEVGSWRTSRLAATWPVRWRTRWSSAAASAATTSSSRGSRPSGSSGRRRSRRARSMRRAPGGPGSCRSTSRRPGSIGSPRSGTGTSAASCGGATASRPGTARTAT